MKKLIIGTIIIVMGFLAGCSKNSDNALVAKVNGTRITVGDVRRQIADLSPETLQMIASDEKARKSILDDIISFELALQEARRQGLENMEFNQRQAALRREMDRRIHEDGKNELVATLLRKELAEKLSVSPTEAEVKDFYRKYRDKMVTADGRKVGIEEAAPEIKKRLISMKQRDAYLSYTGTLREKAKITVNEESLQTLASALVKNPGQDDSISQIAVPNKGAESNGKPETK